MNIFISWSKEPSRSVALALRDWLPNVLAFFETRMSDADIDAGECWSNEISQNLDNSTVGIICLTAENRTQPWVMFKAGAVSHRFTEARVIPYLFGLDKVDLTGPLTQFQMVTATKEGTWKLPESLNNALSAAQQQPQHKLDKLFKMT